MFFNATLTSFQSDIRQNSAPLTKAEAGKGVTMTTINIGDSNDDVSELRGNEVIQLISN